MRPGLVRASHLPSRATGNRVPITDLLEDAHRLTAGTIIQFSGNAALTPISHVTARLHSLSPLPIVWVGGTRSLPFPPDLARAGTELKRLVCVRVHDRSDAARAADALLRSGAVRLIVFDLSDLAEPEPGVLARFMHLCSRYDSGMILIAPEAETALSPAIRTHIHAVGMQGGDPRVVLSVRRTREPARNGVIYVDWPDDVC
jgi:hypothetical protein